MKSIKKKKKFINLASLLNKKHPHKLFRCKQCKWDRIES